MKYEHACFWSHLEITVYSGENISDLVSECFSLVDSFEKKYSRFIKGNFLSKLNLDKESSIDKEFFSLITLCLEVSRKSKWYFDITLLPVLENLWYGICSKKLEENIWYKNIHLTEKNIKLTNDVSIDIWAVGKWYMVDKIYNVLSSSAEEFVVNFGGDMRVKGVKKVFLEDPFDTDKSIGSIDLNWGSIASSAGNKRVFWWSHHLLNPVTKKSQDDKIALYVTHKLASFADIFSTALFVAPLEISIKMLDDTPWLEWLIISKEWKIFKSKWFNCILNIK